MPIQEISLGIVANDGEGNPLREGGEKINQNFTDPLNAASYEVGTGATDVPTNANLSASIAGTAIFSGDVYTFSPAGTGFRPLQAGMYLSFRLPSGSSNTTTTPDINYNGSTYVIKWIDGSALSANDLSEAYNKQPILFYFDGADMLIASDVSGSNATGDWQRKTNGVQEAFSIIEINGNGTNTLSPTISPPKAFSGEYGTHVSCSVSGTTIILADLYRIGKTSGVGSVTSVFKYDSIISSGQTAVFLVKMTGRWY